MSDVNRVCYHVYFSEELIVNILKRLPVKSLLRCMSVCKHWYSVIKNPNFISLHVNRQSNQGPNYLMYREDDDDYRVYVDNDDFDRHLEFRYAGASVVIGCCNGVICFLSLSKSVIVLWNPSLRKSLEIEVPHSINYRKEYLVYWFGFDVASNDYKVVWVAYSTKEVLESRYYYGVYIYSLNEHVWRRVTTSFMLNVSEGYAIGRRGQYLNGVIHWQADTYSDYRIIPELILTFNLADETFEKFFLPKKILYVKQFFDENVSLEEYLGVPCLEDDFDLMAVKRGSKNCLVALHENSLNLNFGVIKEGVVHAWRKELHLSKDDVNNILNVRANGDIVVLRNDGDVFTRDHSGKRLMYISSKIMEFVGTYVESLVLL